MNEETLFHEALARSNLSERAAFLDGACLGKPQLRAAVEALLAAHEASGPFLSPPEADATIDSDARPQKPDSVHAHVSITADYQSAAKPNVLIAGRYTLQEKIGEGGMGEVWVAKQSEPVKRKVALKLIKQGMDSRAVFQRFEQERQALAMMDHPNIAKVFDAGVVGQVSNLSSDFRQVGNLSYGQPFFVMELVNGLPLNKFCDELKLTPKERLELFVPICQAVQHAHQKGIVHRDLKPANILITMIDGKPVPKVIDFGVAKATGGRLTDESISTQFGAIVGTLEYMSPEQASFAGEDIDTRADIYSLGVILYELLTGLRPIDAVRLKKAALTEMIRIIQEEEPSKPSTRLSTDASLPSMAALRQIEPRKLMALLRGELDWVVMKCLEKHRERRYETANALARDVQRYLDGDAVEACPPSVSYRVGKFLKRNKGPVLAASFVFLALVVGFIGTALGLIHANHAQRAEKAQRTRAEAREEMAIDAVKKFRDAVANNPELKSNLTLESLRKTLLKEPLAFFTALRNRLQADGDTRPKSLARLGLASFELGILTDDIGDKQDALIAYRESLAILRKLADANPTEPMFQRDLTVGYNNIGILLKETGKPGEALEAYRAARTIRQKLADANPTVTQFQNDLAANHLNIGIMLSDTGKPDEALKEFESARTIRQKLVDANPTVDQFQSDLANVDNSIGDLLRRTGKPDDALKACESALAILLRLADANPTVTKFQRGLAVSHNSIGNLLNATGKPGEALEAYMAVRTILQKLADANPTVTQFQADLAGNHHNIGNVLSATGKTGEALKAFESARTLRQKLVDANPTVTSFQSDLAASHSCIGDLLSKTGKPVEAVEAIESARTIQRKLVDANPTVTAYAATLASTHTSLGVLYCTTGDSRGGRQAFEAALAIQQTLARDHPESPHYASELGGTLNNMAHIDLDAGRFDAARNQLRQAIVWQKKALAASPRNSQYRQFLTNHLTNLIAAAQGLGDAEGAAEAERELANHRDSDPALKALDQRLSAIIKGDQQPKDNAERLRLAQRAYDKALHATAARLWAEALAADPKLGDDRQAQHYYAAACAAALAASSPLPPGEGGRRPGEGVQVPRETQTGASSAAARHVLPRGEGNSRPPEVVEKSLTEPERAKLRQQALDWLRAELALWSKLVESGPPQAKAVVAQTLAHWNQDTDLTGIRDEKELVKLSESERKEWQSLWTDVDALLAKAKGG